MNRPGMAVNAGIALLAASVLSGLTAGAKAAPVDITDITNVSLGSGGVVNSMTVQIGGGPGTDTLLQSDLINVTLTGYTDSDNAQLTLTDGGSVPSPVASVVEDFSIDSGIANPSSATFTFNAPVVNRPGADIILVDVGGNNDALTVAIGSEDVAYIASTADYSGFAGRAFDIMQSDGGGPFTSVSDLNNATFSLASSTSSSNRNFLLIELDDFLVASGDSITALTITASEYDPMAVFGIAYTAIPEPASMTLFAAAGGLCMLRRRR
ncbi:PEP-CTERM sorting domain-containing protein [Planctomycetales bacterium ZRK34]|nr:PEP-CTERM sorting domain-containing protein [Planctomycetales bacterium ZRK34]